MTTAGGRITAGVGANLIGQHAQDRNQEATCYVGNLDEQITDELLWELFTQAGPVNNIYMPKDRVTNKHKGHAFVEFKGEEDADYAIKVLNMIKVYGKPIRVNKASQEKKAVDVGANLFIGNLDPDVDEKMLYDTFSAFGVIVATPKIMRDPDSGVSKGFGFVSFDNFESSDAAIEAMHGQFLMNRSISAQYAFKKDTNERHGTPEERLMAQNYRMAAMSNSRPNTMFASAPSNNPGMHGGNVGGPPAMPNQGMGAPPPPQMPSYGGAGIPAPPPAASMPGVPSGAPGLLTMPLPGSQGPPQQPPPWGGAYPPHWGGDGSAHPVVPNPGMLGAAPPPPWLQQRPPGFPGMPMGMAPPPMGAQAPPSGMYGPGSAPAPPPPGFMARPPAPPMNPPPAPYPQQAS